MANGGAISPTDELGATQFSVPELRAAVEEAKATGKYVMAHTYTPEGMRNCIEAGCGRWSTAICWTRRRRR